MRMLLALLFAFLLSGCLPSADQQDASVPTLELELNPGRLVMSQIGSMTSMTALLKNEQGNTVDGGQFVWSSSNESVVTVDEVGNVRAHAEGEALISVTANGIERQAQVIVSLGAISIDGSVMYQDKLYSNTGVLAQESYKPVRHAVVDVVNLLGEVMMSTQTDSNGGYSFNVLPTDRYIIRVLAKTASGLGYRLEVNDLSGALYSVTQQLDISTPASADLVISHASGLSAVFNILDVMTSGSEFMQQLNVGTLPALTMYWEQGKGQATYFCNGFHSIYCLQGGGIYVLSSSTGGDADEFDDDVLWHEFGHYVAHYFSRDDSPGGCHVLSSTNLDLRLSWSEGWGDFFPAAVKHWLRSDPVRATRLSIPDTLSTSYYIDLSGNWAMIALDIGAAPATYVDAGNEIAIANVLHQVMLAHGMPAVWQVMKNYMSGVATPVNLEAFWDGWQQLNSPDAQQLANLESIFSSRKINYLHDGYENDNDPARANLLDLNSVQTHHLYRQDGVGDVDVFKFNLVAGQNYVVKTFDITNGGDTHLSLRDANGSELIANDDAADAPPYVSYDARCRVSRITNNGNALASKVEYVPAQSGTYYAHVHTTPDPVPHPSAGRYGSYSITIYQQ